MYLNADSAEQLRTHSPAGRRYGWAYLSYAAVSVKRNSPKNQGGKRQFLTQMSSLRFGNLGQTFKTAGRSGIHNTKYHFPPMFWGVRLSVTLGVSSTKPAATKAVQFNKPINISE